MTDLGELDGVLLVIDLANDYSIETRVRHLIEAHERAGDKPRTLVMNKGTWRRLVDESGGESFKNGYFWTPQKEGTVADPERFITTYRGLPVLVKAFVADQEVLIGV